MCKIFQQSATLFVNNKGKKEVYNISSRAKMTNLKAKYGSGLKYDIRTKSFSLNIL